MTDIAANQITVTFSEALNAGTVTDAGVDLDLFIGGVKYNSAVKTLDEAVLVDNKKVVLTLNGTDVFSAAQFSKD